MGFLAQITDKQYATEFEDEFDEILCYEISRTLV